MRDLSGGITAASHTYAFWWERLMKKTTMKPRAEKDDYHILLGWEELVILLRLCSGHNRLNHLATKMRLLSWPLCPCGLENRTWSTSCRDYPGYNMLKKVNWPVDTPLQTKLCGPQQALDQTAQFVMQTGLSLWPANDEKNSSARTAPLLRLLLHSIFRVSQKWGFTVIKEQASEQPDIAHHIFQIVMYINTSRIINAAVESTQWVHRQSCKKF